MSASDLRYEHAPDRNEALRERLINLDIPASSLRRWHNQPESCAMGEQSIISVSSTSLLLHVSAAARL